MTNYTKRFDEAFEYLEKAIRDRSHLVPKVITDKNGHTRKVLVRPEGMDKTNPRKKTSISEPKIKENHKKISSPIESLKGKYFSVAQFQSYSIEKKGDKWYLQHHSDTGNSVGNAGDITVNNDGSITLHGYSTYASTVADKNGDYAKRNKALREISVIFTKEELENPNSSSFRNKLKDYNSGFSFDKDFTIKRL